MHDTAGLTPRELVRRALRFDPTPRVPRQLWVLPWAAQRHPQELAAIQRDFPDDIRAPEVILPPVQGVKGDPWAVGANIDEWGCEFVRIQPGVLGEVKNPMVRSYESDLDKVRPPYEWVDLDTDVLNRSCAGSEYFMLLPVPLRPFERMQFLRGTQNLCRDLLDQPAGLFELRDRIHEWDLAVIDRWSRTDVDGIQWGDDWGAQQSLLIRPALWRELFKPLYAEYVKRIHAAGKFAFMHTDGYVFDIYEDLIEIGVDAINSQLFCMNIEEIGRRFRGRITFWGEIDQQHTLSFGSSEETRDAVRRVARALYDGSGGVIAQCWFGLNVRSENVRAVFDEWNRVSDAAGGPGPRGPSAGDRETAPGGSK
ncbi:MAG: hypothetical protein JSV19_12595 [Phycisphaerales bacterium]|nr:MAG: hypothetical protein JSV19_12595 [Phycisphaerales bacterium]